MVTDYPQEVAVPPLATSSGDTPHALFERAMMAVQHAFCSLRGHDNLLQFDHNRMFLRCTTCGHETPGWEVERTRLQLRFHGDPDRRLLHGHFTGARKIA
jgi:hypothetical protein